MIRQLFNKESLNVFLTLFSVSSVATIYLNGEESWCLKSLTLLLILVCTLLFTILIFYYKYRRRKKGFVIKDKRTTIICKFDDIFSITSDENKLVVIPVDSNFTIDDGIIPPSSIQGKFIDKYNEMIEKKEILKGFEKKGFYNLNGYILIPIVRLNNKGKAEVKNTLELIKLYTEICEKIEIFSKKKNVIVPLIGSNIKVNNSCLESGERLKLLIDVIKLYDFKQDTKVDILLNADNIDKAYEYMYF